MNSIEAFSVIQTHIVPIFIYFADLVNFATCSDHKVGTNCTLSCLTNRLDDKITFHKDDANQAICLPLSKDRFSCPNYNERYKMEYNLERSWVHMHITPLWIADTGIWSCSHGDQRSITSEIKVYGKKNCILTIAPSRCYWYICCHWHF